MLRRHRHNLTPQQQARLTTYLALLKKHRTRRQCQPLAHRFLRAGYQLGETLHAWREEIAAMWRFTRNNGITEGFHNNMELISRQAYGFRNFENYRLRVKV